MCPWSCWSRSRRTDRARSCRPSPPPARSPIPAHVAHNFRNSDQTRLPKKLWAEIWESHRQKRGWRGVEGEAKLGGKGLRFEAKRLQSRASGCLVWFGFVLFFQFPPPYPQPSPSLISFIVIIINHRPPNRSSGKEGGSWDLGWGGGGGGKNSAVLPEKIRKR